MDQHRNKYKSLNNSFSVHQQRTRVAEENAVLGKQRREDDINKRRQISIPRLPSINKTVYNNDESAGRILQGINSKIMTFRQFSETLDDDIDETEAFRRYEEYKFESSQSKVERFFDIHKDEEWFRHKYHPDDRQKRLVQRRDIIRKRLKCFLSLHDQNLADKLSLDIGNVDKLTQLMDQVAERLEQPIEDWKPLNLDEIVSGTKSMDIDGDSSGRQPAGTRASVHLSNLPSDVTRSEVQEFCEQADKRMIRFALSDPYWTGKGRTMCRRAWVTYSDDVDLKDICWKMNKKKIRNCEIEASLDRGYTRRIRAASNLGSHKSVTRNDLRNASLIVYRFDEQRDIWNLNSDDQCDELSNHLPKELENSLALAMKCVADEVNQLIKEINEAKKGNKTEQKTKETKQSDRPPLAGENGAAGGPLKGANNSLQSFDPYATPETCTFLSSGELRSLLSKSKNPLLAGIGIHLVDETDAEEDELLVLARDYDIDGEFESTFAEAYNQTKVDRDVEPYERDVALLRAIDSLAWYLRIVHSFDYYNGIDYKIEDDMPHRMGLLYVRDTPPTMSDPSTCTDLDTTTKIYLSNERIGKHIESINKKLLNYTNPRNDSNLTEDQRLVRKIFNTELNNELEGCIAVKTKEGKNRESFECKHCVKKFERIEFLRKHVLMKHPDALRVIWADVEFFNSFLFDPDRADLSAPALTKPNNAASNNDSMSSPIKHGGSFSMNNSVTSTPGGNNNNNNSNGSPWRQMSDAESLIVTQGPRKPNSSDPRANEMVAYDDVSLFDAI